LYRARVNASTRPSWPRRPALFLDLDGTLLEFAHEPSAVSASRRLIALLERLPAVTHGATAVVSGRPIDELDELLQPHRLPAAGVHGLQRRSGHEASASPVRIRVEKELEEVRPRLDAFVREHAGTFVEDKGFGLALHYRKRPELDGAVDALAARLRDELPLKLELLRGNKVLEVKPSGFDKGAAIRAFMQEPPFRGRTPVFIGDDVTDETGFRVVNELGGVSVKVGSGATVAKSRLSDVSAVLRWLEELLAGAPAESRGQA
jgi:trehalose 6-phosphate phosphatase